MGLIWTVIIGFLAGAIAKWLTPGQAQGGFLVTVCLGILGSVVATLLGQQLGWYAPGEGTGLLGAVLGAVIILVVFRAVGQRRG